MLHRARGSTLLAVLCLGLGIGASTAIFSIINALLLRPLPVAEADRLIRMSRGQSQFIAMEAASGNYAEVFGVRPLLGRWFAGDREPVAVISDAIWERYFDRRADVLGRVIQSGADSYTIVGVAPREFTGVRAPLRTDLWVPIETRFPLATEAEQQRVARMLMFFGHLRAGATAGEAAAELNALDMQTRGSGLAPKGSAPLAADTAGTLPTPGSRRLAQ